MAVEIFDYVIKYREMSLNIGELKQGTKQPKSINGVIPYHTEINTNDLNLKDGICVFCGVTSQNLMILDLDDEKIFEEFKEYLDKTFISKSGRKGYHLFFRTYDNPKSRSLTNDKNQHIDILGQGKIAVLPPSIHIDTKKPYEIISDNKIKTLTRKEQEKLFQKLTDLGFKINEELKPIKELHDKNYVKLEGENRSEDLLRVVSSWKIKNPELTESMLLTMANQYNSDHFTPPYPLEKVKETVRESFEYGKKKIEENKNVKEKRKEINFYKIAANLMDSYHFITLEKSEEILFYKDGIYREGGKYIISKRSRKIEENIKLNHINEIKGIIKDETGYVSHDEFDKESYLVNMKNFIFNLKTGKTIEHSPDYLSRVKIPTFYDPNALCPRFDKFLSTSLEEDEQKIRTIYEMIALCLIKDSTLIQKAFMNTGKGSNGKSILFGIILAAIGKDNIAAKTIHDFEKNHFAASSLEGKLANICADVGNRGIVETEALKKIISGDPVDCERKYMEGYTFTPYTTLIFSANDIPEITDESDGFARRFELIEWEKSFYGKDRDNSIKTIKNDPAELSGIFNKVSKIAKELLENHELKFESTVEDAKLRWLMRSDSAQRFLDELTTRNPDYYCTVPMLFSNYNRFCQDNGMTPLNDRRFNAKLEKLGLSRSQKKINKVNMKVWLGVNLISELNKTDKKLNESCINVR